MNKVIDITRPVTPEMAIYSGNPEVSLEQVLHAGPDSSAVTKIALGSHTGTHIDAPSHIAKGATGTGSYPLEQMVGTAEIIDLTGVESAITANDLPHTQTERILIKTRNSSGNPNMFDPDFVALEESAAEELVRRKVRLVGIDGLSIKKKGVRDRVHAILLDADVVVLEGVWLADVSPGTYELLCLPLAVDLDGSPARVVLRGE